jgi:hypothetical protein
MSEGTDMSDNLIATLRQAGHDYTDAAADEIEKLRAALRDIARQPEGDEESAQAVARAALGEKE